MTKFYSKKILLTNVTIAQEAIIVQSIIQNIYMKFKDNYKKYENKITCLYQQNMFVFIKYSYSSFYSDIETHM